MAFPFMFGEWPLTIMLGALPGGVAPACNVLPGGTVDVAVDDVLVFMMRWCTVCGPYGAMSDSTRTKGSAPLCDEGEAGLCSGKRCCC